MPVLVQNFKSSTAAVIELCFFMRKKKMKNPYLRDFHTLCDIFIQFLHAVTFLHVDVLRGQIEIETNILFMGIMLDHP